MKKSKDFMLNIKQKSRSLIKNKKQTLNKVKITFIDTRETDQKVLGELSKNQENYSLIRKTESKTLKNRLTSSTKTTEEADEKISFQESENSDLNDNQQIIDNDVNQIQDIDDNSSIISIILFNANKDKITGTILSHK